MRLRILIQNGPEAGRVVEADPSRALVIGRSRDADVPVSDGRVSKHHCRIAFDGSAFTVTDQGSSNGTFVNGARVTSSPLHAGDVVHLGATALLVQEAGSSAGGPPQGAPDALLGKTLGGYRILDRIAEGSRGAVYRAEHAHMKRPGAVKVLAPSFTKDEKAVQRFLREARAGAALKHPNLVQVLDAGEEEGRHFLVMELVEGVELQAVVEREGALAPRRALHLALQVAAALDYAAGHGLVHRDLRPANVLVTAEGVAKVIDLGTALSLTGGGGLSLVTSSSLPMQEANYAAPEVLFGEKDIDPRADLYSLGVVLYFLLTTKLPYAVHNARAFLDDVRAERYLSPKAHVQAIPDEVCHIIATLMAQDRAERYPDALSFLRDALGWYGRTYGTETVPASALDIPGAKEWASARSGTRYESRVARDVQAKLVPASLPSIPGHAVAKVYRPVKVVGGDYYDVIPLPSGKHLLVVVDSGHRGVSGAMLMVLARSVIQAAGETELSPSAALARLDETLRRDLQGGYALHAAIAVIDPETSDVAYASAGETPPILWRAASGEASPLPGGGAMVGAEGFAATKEQAVTLAPGDRLLLYSDGMTAVLDTHNRPFGTEGLAQALSRVKGVPLDGALERLTMAMEAHRGPSPVEDDVTVLGLERDRD